MAMRAFKGLLFDKQDKSRSIFQSKMHLKVE